MGILRTSPHNSSKVTSRPKWQLAPKVTLDNSSNYWDNSFNVDDLSSNIKDISSNISSRPTFHIITTDTYIIYNNLFNHTNIRYHIQPLFTHTNILAQYSKSTFQLFTSQYYTVSSQLSSQNNFFHIFSILHTEYIFRYFQYHLNIINIHLFIKIAQYTCTILAGKTSSISSHFHTLH